VTAIVRGLIEELRPKASEPGLFLTELNRGLIAILKRADEPLLSTACYAVADTETDEVLLARAGHPMPLRIRREAGRVEPLCPESEAKGVALGLFENAVYSATRCRLDFGDLMLLFTDGVYEVLTRDGDMFGLHGLRGAVEKRMHLPAKEIFEGVLAEVQSVASEEEIQDDVCLLALERGRDGE
jgi:sigma-B regulation protein RsbU (phosphoserine phosphatase)